MPLLTQDSAAAVVCKGRELERELLPLLLPVRAQCACCGAVVWYCVVCSVMCCGAVPLLLLSVWVGCVCCNGSRCFCKMTEFILRDTSQGKCEQNVPDCAECALLKGDEVRAAACCPLRA